VLAFLTSHPQQVAAVLKAAGSVAQASRGEEVLSTRVMWPPLVVQRLTSAVVEWKRDPATAECEWCERFSASNGSVTFISTECQHILP